MFKRLRNKFLLSNVILTSVVLLGAFALLFSLVYWNARNDSEKRLLALPACAEQNEITPIPAAGSVVHYITDIVVSGDHLGSSTFFKIIVTSNSEISKGNPDYWLMEEAYKKMAQSAWEHQNIHRVISIGSSKWQSIIVPSSTTSGDYDIYFMDVSSAQALLENLLYTFLVIVPIVLLAVYLISWKMANNAVRPISEAWEKQRRFAADASHELKTPLAIITANTDALLLETENDLEQREKWISYIKDETTRMAGLVNELLYLARIEDGTKQELCARFDFGQCISEACVIVEAMIYEKSITLEYEIAPDIMLESNEAKVRKLISILLDNAIKYTNAGGSIRICLKRNKNTALMSVENTGPGIAADMLPYIFDRFFRADKARENEDGSYGLGLSIAKSISEQLGAELTVSSIPGQSTIFIFRIKAAI